MKKKIIIGSVIGAAVIALAGCGGTGGSESQATTTATTAAETTSATTETTTGTEKTTEATTEKTSEATTTATEETTNSDSGSTESPAQYTLKILKAADGFEIKDDLYCVSKDSNDDYIYIVEDDVTNHYIENELDGIASTLSDSDTGRSGDILYAKGKQDNGYYTVMAYKYVGTGDSVSSYVGIEYVSEKEANVEDVIKLLSDEYISVSK